MPRTIDNRRDWTSPLLCILKLRVKEPHSEITRACRLPTEDLMNTCFICVQVTRFPDVTTNNNLARSRKQNANLRLYICRKIKTAEF